MFRKFVNRKEEVNFLEKRYKSDSFEFFVAYGRRRVGKTELIKEFIRLKPHLYFLCDKGGTERNFSRFKKKMADFLAEPPLASEDWEEIFSHLVKRIKEKKIKKTVIVFDEFSYLVEKDDAIPSFFQTVIDEILNKENIMLILLGSSISMMEKGVLSSKSPLYGRKTAHLKVEPISFFHYADFFPRNSLEKNIEFYAVLGGVPFYLIHFSDKKTIAQNITDEIFSRHGHLYEEIDFLLKEEFRETGVYRSILEAISGGASKLVEIANRSKLPVRDMDRYLKSLMNIGIIKREVLITKKKSKKSIYSVEDNFFKFWFYFCEPFKSDLAIGELTRVQSRVRSELNQFVSKYFEELIRKEFLRKIFPHFVNTGRWWGHCRQEGKRREIEIDIVSLNEESNEILFGECKWKEKMDATELLSKLKEKAQYVEWRKGKRKEFYVLFAKSFKDEIKEPGCFLFDLKNLEEIIKKR